MTTKWSGSLRLFMVAVVLLAVIIPGYLNRSAWIILLATPAYTALYALGKWNTWKLAWQRGGVTSILLAILVTLPIQMVLVAILYLIGLGLSMLMGASNGIQALTSGDIMAGVVLFLFAVMFASIINVLEAKAGGTPAEAVAAVQAMLAEVIDQGEAADEELELDMDPRPLTSETLFISTGYWKRDALYDALEKRGETVVKAPEAASEAGIAAAEARLGMRLPERLRDLYKIMDGGYVGTLYVPLREQPEPVYEDWRGAFAIDYSSLASLDQLRTVKDAYDDFTHEPEEVPPNADKLLILQQRYLDTTLLDYSRGPEPKVRIVDFDEYSNRSTDIEFADFDAFFAALRRPKKEKQVTGEKLFAYRARPIGDMMPAQQPSEFWGSGNVHVFKNIAASRQDGSEPKKQADDELVAQTEARLGVTLPTALANVWKYRNGGTVSARFIQTSKPGEAYEEARLTEQLMPMEYFTTLADVSDRIVFPAGETSLRERHAGAEKLIVLEAKHKEAVLLDYRTDPQQPAVLVVDDIENQSLDSARRIESFDILLTRLRGSKRPG